MTDSIISGDPVVEQDAQSRVDALWAEACAALACDYLQDVSAVSLALGAWRIVRVEGQDGNRWGIDAFSMADQLHANTAGQQVAPDDLAERYKRYMILPGEKT